MERILAKTLPLVIAALLLLFGALDGGLAVSAEDKLELSNEYIRIVVNTSPTNTGRFSVGTTGGDPDRETDRNKHLIYGGDQPWTSYTTIRVGNENWVFGGDTQRRAGRDGRYGEVIQQPTIRDGAIVTVWQVGPIEVTQKLSLVRSSTTGLMDSARIEYQVHNADTVSHLVGVRAMLDTMLGENDGAPFRVEDQALLTDTVFYANEMPDFWQAFDSLADPQVMAQGTLSGDEVTTPDRVYFTNWGSLADELWNFDFQPGRDFTRKGEFELDSAIALFWDPLPLQPNESRSYVTHYGLGGVTLAPGDLSLGVTSPSRVTADSHHRQSFPIIAYIENTGAGEARDVTATISLPEGLSLVEGTAQKRLGDLDVGETIQTSWQVLPAEDASGTLDYQVKVAAINAESNQVSRRIDVVTPARIQAELRGPLALSIQAERLAPLPIEVTAVLRNVGGSEAHRVQVGLEHPIGLRLASGDRTTKHPGTVGAGEEARVTWHLLPDGVSGNLPYSLKVQSSAGEQVVNNFVLIPSVVPKVWVGEPAADEPVLVESGDYFSLSIWATNIPDFVRAALDLRFDPEVVEIVGRTLDITKGTLFVDDSTQPPRTLGWTMPSVDNASGTVRGLLGDRGDDKAKPNAFGTLVTIHFRARGPGDAEIEIDDVRIEDAQGRTVTVQLHSQPVIVASQDDTNGN